MSVSWEVSVNVSFSFGHNDANQIQCSAVLVWLKIAYFPKYLSMCKSKKNFFQNLF